MIKDEIVKDMKDTKVLFDMLGNIIKYSEGKIKQLSGLKKKL